MKNNKLVSANYKPLAIKANVKTLLKMEGKMVHGTFGKPTNGARGNKRY